MSQHETKTDTWLNAINKQLRQVTTHQPSGRFQANISAHVDHGRLSLYLPPEMAELQPECLQYLQAFAKRHSCRLVEDRRSVDVQPIIEHRKQRPSAISAGVGALLRQTGMSSPRIALSSPHRLHKNAEHIPMNKLLRYAQHSVVHGKQVFVQPNEVMVDILGTDSYSIAGHACKFAADDRSITLAYFTSNAFHAVGYHSSNQFVVHIFYAGGTAANAALWTSLKTFAGSHLRFTLFPGNTREEDFGVLNTTLYLNIEPTVAMADDGDEPTSVAVGSK